MGLEIKSAIRIQIMKAAKLAKLDDHEEIVEKSYLDSMQFVELGAWIERQFGIAVTNEDFSEENFSTLFRISRLVEQKVAAKANRR